MKGYWHFPAIAAACSILTIALNTYALAVALFIWLSYLYYFKHLRIFPIVLSFLSFLFFSAYIPSIDDTIEEIVSNPLAIQSTGKIISSITKTDKRISFTIKNDKKQSVLVVLFLKKDEASVPYNELKHGAVCTINGVESDASTARNPGQFDYSLFLKKQGITKQLTVKSAEHIKCEGSSKLLHRIHKMRNVMTEYINEAANEKTAPWINALIFGERALLDEDTVDLFNRWSLSHLLAISGLHIGIIVAIMYTLFVRFNIVTKEKALWIVLLFLPLYSFLAGSQPSVLRATMMTTFVIVLKKFDYHLRIGDVISIIFLIYILFDKYIVYQLGFQFSFVVTFALILSREWFGQTNVRLYQLFQISFVSQMAILPLYIVHFSTFHPLSIFLNVVVVPYFTLFVLPYLFVLLVLSIFPSFVFHMVENMFIWTHDLFLTFLKAVDKWTYFPFITGEISLHWIIVYCILFVIFMYNLQIKQIKQAFYYGCCIVVLVIWLPLRPYFSPVGVVTMLDIGQGDAFIIELPYRNGVFIVDAGSEFSFTSNEPNNKVYKQIIRPYMHSRGIHTVDAVFLSHEDIDHVGSLNYIIDDLIINEVIISNAYEMDLALEKKLRKKGV
ncbi:DNA internalization-related competence protein ComEC/Rec2, partial [Virgibacillus sp. W0430]|uniref:DNA internalization-related competence protein ComEC/Rec2 n=1 Tax=Virgibacillus sp. W0430 TaxID=3391580 RepID=UPI003F473C34